mgnify:CR=1 FL=1
MSNNNNEMKKELGMGAAMATVVGCVIGSGVFFKPTAIYTATGGAPGLAIIAWVVTSLVCLCAAMTFAEIAILIPETGGMPVYLKKVFGDRVGYLCGWMQTVVFYPGLVAALAVAVANQAKLFLGDGMVVPVAIVCIIIMVALNCMGAKVGGAAQTIFTVAKLIPLVLIMMFGGFIIGKLVDSLIIGIICFIGVTILNMPFPMLLSVIIGVTNVIPFFGPFIGAIPAAFLVFLVSPLQCVYFLIWILLLQQFDGNILGPKILGNSTGLSSFWVLFSILFFGGLFGFVGMIIAVPAFAAIYDLISRAVHRSLRLRKLPMETDEYRKLDHIDEKTGMFMELNKK